MSAVAAQQPEIADLLLLRGADAKVVDEYGLSALHWAAYFGPLELVEALLGAGIDPVIRSREEHPSYGNLYKGSTAWDLARRGGQPEIAELLAPLTHEAAAVPKVMERAWQLGDHDHGAVDFEGCEAPVGNRVAEALEDRFITIGRNGARALICLWHHDPSRPIDVAPIAWLDSEGTPASVIAESFDDLLALLPYGTSFLYDVVCAWERHLDDGGPHPTERYPESAVAAALEETGPDGWIEETFGIGPSADPVAAIGRAIDAHPRLARWLETNA